MKRNRLPLIMFLIIFLGFSLHYWQLHNMTVPIELKTLSGDISHLENLSIHGVRYSNLNNQEELFYWKNESHTPYNYSMLMSARLDTTLLEKIPFSKRPKKQYMLLAKNDRYELWYHFDEKDITNNLNYLIYDNQMNTYQTNSIELESRYPIIQQVAIHEDQIDLLIENSSTHPNIDESYKWLAINLNSGESNTIQEANNYQLPPSYLSYFNMNSKLFLLKDQQYVLVDPVTKKETLIANTPKNEQVMTTIENESKYDTHLDIKEQIVYQNDTLYWIDINPSGLETLYQYNQNTNTYDPILRDRNQIFIRDQQIHAYDTEADQFKLTIIDINSHQILYEGLFTLPTIDHQSGIQIFG